MTVYSGIQYIHMKCFPSELWHADFLLTLQLKALWSEWGGVKVCLPVS